MANFSKLRCEEERVARVYRMNTETMGVPVEAMGTPTHAFYIWRDILLNKFLIQGIILSHIV